MLAYCHDSKTCRRTLIGRHFSEKWKSDECHEMCDNCRRTGDQSDGRLVILEVQLTIKRCPQALLLNDLKTNLLYSNLKTKDSKSRGMVRMAVGSKALRSGRDCWDS